MKETRKENTWGPIPSVLPDGIACSEVGAKDRQAPDKEGE